MGEETDELARAWEAFASALRTAGHRLTELTAGLSASEQADGQRALLRALHNQLGRFEVDRERPELVPFNGWRQKFFMDNPDFLYWVADLNPERRYRVRGHAGDAAYVSLTAYRSEDGKVRAVERFDSDTLELDASRSYDVTVGGSPANPINLWVRHFHGDLRKERTGWCAIEPLGEVASPNTLRAWSEMTGGAVYAEPGISYLRGGWQLADDEALVVEGRAPRR